MRKRQRSAKVSKKRWAAYVLAGASVVCGGSQTATADITVVEPGVLLRDPDPSDPYDRLAYRARFGEAGISGNYLEFLHASIGYGSSVYGVAAVRPGYYMSVVGFQRDWIFLSNISYGANISTLPSFQDTSFGVMVWGDVGGVYDSQFLNTGGYFALRFDVGDGTQYGWVELSLNQGAPLNIFTLERYAWASPGQSLRIGQTSVPEAGSLGLLALGSAGLLLWRRSRSKTGSKTGSKKGDA